MAETRLPNTYDALVDRLKSFFPVGVTYSVAADSINALLLRYQQKEDGADLGALVLNHLEGKKTDGGGNGLFALVALFPFIDRLYFRHLLVIEALINIDEVCNLIGQLDQYLPIYSDVKQYKDYYSPITQLRVLLFAGRLVPNIFNKQATARWLVNHIVTVLLPVTLPEELKKTGEPDTNISSIKFLQHIHFFKLLSHCSYHVEEYQDLFLEMQARDYINFDNSGFMQYVYDELASNSLAITQMREVSSATSLVSTLPETYDNVVNKLQQIYDAQGGYQVTAHSISALLKRFKNYEGGRDLNDIVLNHLLQSKSVVNGSGINAFVALFAFLDKLYVHQILTLNSLINIDSVCRVIEKFSEYLPIYSDQTNYPQYYSPVTQLRMLVFAGNSVPKLFEGKDRARWLVNHIVTVLLPVTLPEELKKTGEPAEKFSATAFLAHIDFFQLIEKCSYSAHEYQSILFNAKMIGRMFVILKESHQKNIALDDQSEAWKYLAAGWRTAMKSADFQECSDKQISEIFNVIKANYVNEFEYEDEALGKLWKVIATIWIKKSFENIDLNEVDNQKIILDFLKTNYDSALEMDSQHPLWNGFKQVFLNPKNFGGPDAVKTLEQNLRDLLNPPAVKESGLTGRASSSLLGNKDVTSNDRPLDTAFAGMRLASNSDI